MAYTRRVRVSKPGDVVTFFFPTRVQVDYNKTDSSLKSFTCRSRESENKTVFRT